MRLCSHFYWVLYIVIICIDVYICYYNQVIKQLNHHKNYLYWLWITITHLPSNYSPLPETTNLYSIWNISHYFLFIYFSDFFTAKERLGTYRKSLSFMNLARRRKDYDTHALVIFVQITIDNIWLYYICKIIKWSLTYG